MVTSMSHQLCQKIRCLETGCNVSITHVRLLESYYFSGMFSAVSLTPFKKNLTQSVSGVWIWLYSPCWIKMFFHTNARKRRGALVKFLRKTQHNNATFFLPTIKSQVFSWRLTQHDGKLLLARIYYCASWFPVITHYGCLFPITAGWNMTSSLSFTHTYQHAFLFAPSYIRRVSLAFICAPVLFIPLHCFWW